MKCISCIHLVYVGEDEANDICTVGCDLCQICFHSQELHEYSPYYCCLADLLWLAWILMRDHAVVKGDLPCSDRVQDCYIIIMH